LVIYVYNDDVVSGYMCGFTTDQMLRTVNYIIKNFLND